MYMKRDDAKEKQFLDVTSRYKDVIAKVCWLYVSPVASFDDLYQEVLINLWQGFDNFRGEAKISTWIYRAAINTCITWQRRNGRHSAASLDDIPFEPMDSSDADAQLEDYRTLRALINRLGMVDKAIITLWLDENSYDEIAAVVGLSTQNVAVRIHRIKDKLSKMARESE